MNPLAHRRYGLLAAGTAILAAAGALAAGAPGDGNVAEFTVDLPREVRPMPEPLTPGAEPGFKLRGTKGWNWTPEQYLEEVPVLAAYKMNFLMNCYLSMYSHAPQFRNEWWQPMPEARKEAYAKVIRACREKEIRFCFALHPQLHSPRPIEPRSDADFGQLWPHFAWAQGLGVRWFSLPLDDVKGKVDASDQAFLVNRLLAKLREKDKGAQLIFCPTRYWGDGSNPAHRPYLETLAREVHPDVYLFWTGPQVVSPTITRRDAEGYRAAVRHRLILWDNYPVNNDQPLMQLGPLSGRDPQLGEIIDGYMSNPMCRQNRMNRLPLLTCADYAYNPKAYDPGRSIGQAILHLGQTEAQRQVLKEMVEAYPGMLAQALPRARANAVRERYGALSGPAAKAYIRTLEELSARLGQTFGKQYEAEKMTLDKDIEWLRQQAAKSPNR